MKTALILEGGAMRGLFSAGVMDVMLEHGVNFDGGVGVSAGAAFGANFISRQVGRTIRYNKRFANDWRYCSLRSWITTGDLFGAEFAYHELPDRLDPFDRDAFERNEMVFYVVCTDVETGQAVYKECRETGYEMLEWVRASASMPLVSRIVELEGHKLLDGGVADSIPLAFMERQGYGRNVVITTQPAGFVKKPTPFMPLMRWSLRKYPQMIRALAERHIMYNKQLDYLSRQEKSGTALVIRPDESLKIGHTCHDADEMQRVYDQGRKKGSEMIHQIIDFLKEA